jgi:hypothetical protein
MNGRKSIAIVTGTVVALVVASAALGAGGTVRPRPDDRAGIRGPAAWLGSAAARPDDRAGLRGPTAPGRVTTPGPTATRVTDARFDWGSAGIGAAAGAGSILLLLGAFLLVRPRSVEARVA